MNTMIAAPINHISVDSDGVAYISGTRIKVSHLARSPQRVEKAA